MRKYKNAKGTAYRRGKNLQLTRKVKNSKTSEQIYSKNWPKYGGSLKACFVDADLDGFKDSVRSKYRSPAVLKGNACHVLPPIPITGPSNISASIATPITGPSNISAEIIHAPISGPSNISAEIIAPISGPSNLTDLIIVPSTLNLIPWNDLTLVDRPILGVPTADRTSFLNGQTVSILTPSTFTYTQTWGTVSSPTPIFQATFSHWQTTLPLVSDTTLHVNGSIGPWPVSGATYTVKPIYTTVRIN